MYLVGFILAFSVDFSISFLTENERIDFIILLEFYKNTSNMELCNFSSI